MHDDSSRSKDIHVVRGILDGDVDAFEILLQRYQHHVFSMVRKHVPQDQVEETAHDVFIRAYQSLKTFKGRSSFKYWLSAIAVRTCCDYWRKQYKLKELPVGSLTDGHTDRLRKVISDASLKSFNEQRCRKEAREVLDWALDHLSAEDRIVVELVYLEGLSGKEAAKFLGWSVANVKIRSFRSRKKLRRILTEWMKG